MEKVHTTYISLAEAAKQCEYSQEYLSLRARQGKLKSKKIGRNWVTTSEWLRDYIRQAEEYKLINWNGKKTFSAAAVASTERNIGRLALPPENLPIGEPLVIFEKESHPVLLPRIAFAATFAALVVMLGTLGFLSATNTDYAAVYGDYREWLTEQVSATGLAAATLTSDVIKGQAQLNFSFGAVGEWLIQAAQTVKDDLQFAWNSAARRLGFLPKIPEEKAIAVQDSDLSQKTTELEQTIIGDIQRRFGEFREDTGLGQDHGDSEGLVVVPSTDKDEEIKERLKSSFSDEVVVERVDETSGIIRPIFRKVAEQAYLYMMVPLKN